MNELELRAKIASEMSDIVFTALENCACMGSQANRPGPGKYTYVQRLHDMIMLNIKGINLKETKS